MFHALLGSHRHDKQCTRYSARPAVWLLSHIGCLQFITTNQGREIEPKCYQTLAKLCVIKVLLTRSQHSVANGLVDHFHWTLKALSMYHTRSRRPTRSTQSLESERPSRICTCPMAKIVYGEPLCILWELRKPRPLWCHRNSPTNPTAQHSSTAQF
jgi:hypothetical protein